MIQRTRRLAAEIAMTAALLVSSVASLGQDRQTPQDSGRAQLSAPALGKGLDADGFLRQAIASTTFTRSGRLLPVIPLEPNSAKSASQGGASCELYDTTSFTGAAIDLESGNHVKTNVYYPPAGPQVEIYSPPNADWVVQSYSRTVTTAGPPYQAGDSAFPAGYSFLSSGNYSAVTNTVQSYVASLNIPNKAKIDINANLATMISNISSYSMSIGASHGTVKHNAQIQGTGVFNTTTGHSWYHGYISGTLICAPGYLHDQAALIARLKGWVNQVVSRLPHEVVVMQPPKN